MVKAGKIRYPGFSFHDSADVFKKVIDSYPWKLAQVQMNILDEDNQATMRGIEYAASRGIGIVIMEPLRGGALTKNVPESVKLLYEAMPEKRTPAEWAFRYLYNRPEIVTILSGMTTYDQLSENLKVFESAEPNCLNASEVQLYKDVRAAYQARVRVGCTGCAYCQPCPRGVRIPDIFGAYDNAAMFDSFENFYRRFNDSFRDNVCIKCGKCESVCPQHIEIRNWLSRINDEATSKV